MGNAKKILILTSDAGFGHRSAANAIEAAFGTSLAGQCEVRVANPLNSKKAPGWLRNLQSDYDLVARKMPELYRIGFDLSDMSVACKVMENALSVLLFRCVRDAFRDFGPDAIIVTFPLYLPALVTVFALESATCPSSASSPISRGSTRSG